MLSGFFVLKSFSQPEREGKKKKKRTGALVAVEYPTGNVP